MAQTWGDFLQSIPYRLNRSDLTQDFVETVANEQIVLFGPQLFYPSEQIFQLTLPAGQQLNKLPAGFQALRYVRVLFNGIWIPVPIVDYTYILSLDPLQPPFTSLPVSLCAVYGNQIRFFPTPNAEYTAELTLFGTVVGPTDYDDTTNFWVNDGNVFLRAATCLAICQEYLDSTTPNSPRIAIWKDRTDTALALLQTQAHATTQPSTVRQHL